MRHARRRCDPGAHGLDSQTRLCRAPCGWWLGAAEGDRYEVRADGTESSSALTLHALKGDVNVSFVPRDEVKYRLGPRIPVLADSRRRLDVDEAGAARDTGATTAETLR